MFIRYGIYSDHLVASIVTAKAVIRDLLAKITVTPFCFLHAIVFIS